jgi:hypothetical protein
MEAKRLNMEACIRIRIRIYVKSEIGIRIRSKVKTRIWISIKVMRILNPRVGVTLCMCESLHYSQCWIYVKWEVQKDELFFYPPKSNEQIIEGQAFLRSYDSAPRLQTPPLSCR